MLIFLYVAVVRDTDGSAFITKAEFDSLKNNFQAQIDNYNTSIDSKIDGAISAYLAGIKLSRQAEVPLCAGSVQRLVFFTPSVQGNNWNRGFMGIDVTDQRSGLLRRSGSYDYFGVMHTSRDASAKPFEALIIKDGGIFYTNNYQLTYHNNIWACYFNKDQTANYFGYNGGALSWHGDPNASGGQLAYVDKKTNGSDGGGAGKCSHYPLRSDWWACHIDYTYGSIVCGSTTSNYGTYASGNLYSVWRIQPSFTDNLDYVEPQFFCTQGSTTSKKLQTWTYSLTSIAGVADLSSGWTTATDRQTTLPSDNNVIIDNQFAGTSLSQSTNWSTQRNNVAGKWATKTNTSLSGTAVASNWYEPELQMEETSHSVAWINKNSYVNKLQIASSSWNAYPFNGFPIVKWQQKWQSLTFNVNNTNGDSLQMAFSDNQFAKDYWIENYSTTRIKVELDGTPTSASNFTLPTGTHEIKISPTANIDQLFVTVGWNSKTKTERGYLEIPNLGIAVSE